MIGWQTLGFALLDTSECGNAKMNHFSKNSEGMRHFSPPTFVSWRRRHANAKPMAIKYVKTRITSLAVHKDWNIRSKVSMGFDLQTGDGDCGDGAARLAAGLPSVRSNWSFGLD